MLRQLKDLGAPAEVIAAAANNMKSTICEVFADCWQSLEVFLTLGSQWRVVSGMGGMFYQGLDFNSIEPCFRLLGIPRSKRAELFKDLLVMQAEAASVINKRNG